LLAAYIGGPVAQAGWLGPKVSGHLAPFLYSSREPSELSQWLCHDDSTINIVVVLLLLLLFVPVFVLSNENRTASYLSVLLEDVGRSDNRYLRHQADNIEIRPDYDTMKHRPNTLTVGLLYRQIHHREFKFYAFNFFLNSRFLRILIGELGK